MKKIFLILLVTALLNASEGGDITRVAYVDIDEIGTMLLKEKETYYGLEGKLYRTEGKIKKISDDIKLLKTEIEAIEGPSLGDVLTDIASNEMIVSNTQTNESGEEELVLEKELTDEEKARLKQLNDDLQTKRDELGQLLKEAENQQMLTTDMTSFPVSVKRGIYTAIRRVARREGFSVVLDRFIPGLIYIDRALDITLKVMEEIRLLSERNVDEIENGEEESEE